MDISDDQRISLCGRIYPTVLHIELYDRSNERIKEIAGVVLSRKVVATSHQALLEPGLERATARFYNESEITLNLNTAVHENEFIATLQPADKNYEFPEVADLSPNPETHVGAEVFSVSHGTEDDNWLTFCFLRGEVSQISGEENGLFRINNLHSLCLGGPVFNQQGLIIGLICGKNGLLDVACGIAPLLVAFPGLAAAQVGDPQFQLPVGPQSNVYNNMLPSIVRYSIFRIPSSEPTSGGSIWGTFMQTSELMDLTKDMSQNERCDYIVSNGTEGSATGVVVNDEKWILTTAHSVDGNYAPLGITFTNNFGSKGSARVLRVLKKIDLALLEITKFTRLNEDDTGLVSANLGSEEDVKISKTVYTIGHPKGKEAEYSFSRGHITQSKHAMEYLQTKEEGTLCELIALANMHSSPGSSGGPVFTESGKVIGLVSHDSSAYNMFDLAVHINHISGFLKNEKEKKESRQTRKLSSTMEGGQESARKRSRGLRIGNK